MISRIKLYLLAPWYRQMLRDKVEEKLLLKIASLFPKPIVYWTIIRAGTMTMKDSPSEVSLPDILETWDYKKERR